MTTFARLTVRGAMDERPRTGWYQIVADGPEYIVARPVNAAGVDRSRLVDGIVVDVVEIIGIGCILKRQNAQFSRQYGTLETARVSR